MPGNPTYGLADPIHHHAICTRCGRVTEIAPGTLAGVTDAAEQVTGFALQPTGLALHGLCPTCR